MEETYMSDVLDLSLLDKTKFNLVVAGCGTGKSYFVMNNLRRWFPDVKPYEILVVTSRALTRDQQARNKNMERYTHKILPFLNGEVDDYTSLTGAGIQICCYGNIIDAISTGTKEGHVPLEGAKIIVFDECHTLFSDEFIEDMKWLRNWIVLNLPSGKHTIIGMTATPSIIYYSNKRGIWGAEINRLNKDPIVKYKAAKLICTNFDTIPYLIATNRLPGKTMIMCATVDDCYKLQAQLCNAAVMISPYSDKYDKETMDGIRDYIRMYESLPDSFHIKIDGRLEERNLDVLICTSTAREGFNLRESSDVRNIISCFTDELHVTQFAGRCRYNLDNIVVAKTLVRNDNLHPNTYLSYSRLKFNEFMADRNSSAWFNSISHLVSHDIYGAKRFVLGSDDVGFIAYMNEKWLLPKGVSAKEAKKYRIWRPEDRDEVRNKAILHKLIDDYPSNITFNGIINLLRGTLGYEIDNGVFQKEGKQHTYKLVINFDEDAITYKKQVKGVDD